MQPRHCAFRFVRGCSCFSLSFLGSSFSGIRRIYKVRSKQCVGGVGRAGLGPVVAGGNYVLFRRDVLSIRYGGVCSRRVSRVGCRGRRFRSVVGSGKDSRGVCVTRVVSV